MIPDRAKADAWDEVVSCASRNAVGSVCDSTLRKWIQAKQRVLQITHPPEHVQHSSVRKVSYGNTVGWECMACERPAPSEGHVGCSAEARPTPWRSGVHHAVRESDTLPVPAIHGPSCTMSNGRCIGYHCPRCGAATGSQGHTCPKKP